jgi:sugar O-acyltransferase (sialic acid O-acetyltransferase NeuD family)
MIETSTCSLIVVYGASGHGKVVADILLSQRISVAGFVDDDVTTNSADILGLKVLGNGKWLFRNSESKRVVAALGIGDNANRRRIAEECMGSGVELLTAVHSSAVVAPSAYLSPGVVVMAAAVINPDAHIGMGAIINTAAVVEHDCRVGDFAHLSPNSTMGGGAQLGSLSWLGMGAEIIHGVTVGAGTIIAAGAVAVRDIPDRVVAMGIPARVRPDCSGNC